MNNAQRTVVLFFSLLLAPVCFYVGGTSSVWRWMQGEALAFIAMRLVRVVLPVVFVGFGLYVWAGWDEGSAGPGPRIPLLGPIPTLLVAGSSAALLGGLLLWARSS